MSKILYTFEHDKIEYCGQCPCFNDEGGGCQLGYRCLYRCLWRSVEQDDVKPYDCPLVEVD